MDVLDILKKVGVEVPADKLDEFNKDFRIHYKSAGEHRKVKDELAKAQESLSTSGDFEARFNELQKKYDSDIQARDKQISDMVFDAKLDKALVGVEFTSDRVKNSVISEIKAKGMKPNEKGEIEGLNDYLKTLYKSEPNSFKTVDDQIHTWAGGSDKSKENTSTQTGGFVFGRLI